jgi:hypothetical protein
MTLYLDVHRELRGLTVGSIADAHARDVALADQFGVRCLEVWFAEGNGTAVCLMDAPSAEAIRDLHRASHGLMATEVLAVVDVSSLMQDNRREDTR